jgi:hypothetical protein
MIAVPVNLYIQRSRALAGRLDVKLEDSAMSGVTVDMPGQ